MDQDKKQKAIQAAIEQIKKQTKDPEAVIRLGDEAQKKYSKGAISTGSISLDSSIGIGGAVVVLSTMVVNLTLVPSILLLVGQYLYCRYCCCKK